MGSAAVLELARRGARVLGLDRYGPGHALGSSHGGTRIYRQSYLEDPAYVPLLLRAWDRWAALVADSGSDVFVATGGLYAGLPGGGTVGAGQPAGGQGTFSGSLRSARQWGLPHEVLDPAAVARRFPVFRLAPGELALYEERAGYARPKATVRAQLRLAAAAGAELRFDEPVLAWEAGPPARVRTALGAYEADRLVLTPGAWAPELAALDVPMVVERQVMHWIAPAGPIEPYEGGPVFIAGDGPDQVYGFPAVDGPTGGVKVSFFRAGEPTTPETVDRTVRPGEVEELRRRAAQLLPGLTGPPVAATVCLYTTTPDSHFVVGPHPAHDNVVVACGFSGHGFKFVPVVGEILADLALDGSTRHPIGLFDPLRFASH
jgi:sarcosine oxidase